MRYAARSWSVLSILIGFAGLFTALLGGLVFALYGAKFGLIFTVLVGGMFALMLPIDWLVLTTWVLATIVAGTVQYLLDGWKYAQWLPFAVAFACTLRLPVELLRTSHQKRTESSVAHATSATLVLLSVFFATAVFSTLINEVNLFQAIVAFKNSGVMWAIALLIAYGCLRRATIDQMWRSLMWILVTQLPMVLYQFLVVVARRSKIRAAAPADAIAGTFGGNPNAGGANSELVLFALMAAFIAFSYNRAGRLSGLKTGLIALLALVVIFLGEVKVVVVLLPVAGAVLYADRLFRSPKLLLLWGAMVAIFIGSLLMIYQELYWSKLQGDHHNIATSIEQSISYITDPRNIDYSTGEVGRAASLNLWVTDSRNYIVQQLIGNGANSSRGDSSIAVGDVARRFAPLNIAATGVSQLLWDFGIVGLLAYIGIFLAGIVEATQALKRAVPDSDDEIYLRLTRSLLAMCLILIPYNNHLLDQASLQVLVGLAIGHLVWFRRNQVSLGYEPVGRSGLIPSAARIDGALMRSRS